MKPNDPTYPASLLLLLLLLSSLSCGLFVGCNKKKPQSCPAFRVAWSPAPRPNDPVIAKVNSVPILRSEVLGRMRELNIAAPQALDELIDLELLAQEARRQGYLTHPEVVAEAKSAAVYKLLATTFEKEVTPKTVPESLIRKSYQINKKRFVRPELRRFSHILIMFPWKRKRRKLVIFQDEIQKAGKLAATLAKHVAAEAASRKLSWKEFGQLSDLVRHQGLEIRVEHSTKAHKDLAKSFADALFALKQPGAVSGVVKTKYGLHVILLVEIFPPKNISYEEARSEVLAKVFPEVRTHAFLSFLGSLKARCKVELYPERIPIECGDPEAEMGPTPKKPRKRPPDGL